MPDLYISALGNPFRAVVASASGKRTLVKIGDRRDNEFALEPVVWVDQEGAVAGSQARYLERSGNLGESYRVRLGDPLAEAESGNVWSRRDLLAALFRRLLTLAETQAGEAIARVVCIVPNGTTPGLRGECVQAALLAGAQRVDTISLETMMAPGEAIVEVWDDRASVTVRGDGGEPQRFDVSPHLSRGEFQRALGSRFAEPADAPAGLHDEIAGEIFNRWLLGKDVSSGVTLTRPVPRGAPLTVFLPPRAFARFDDAVAAAMTKVLTICGIAPDGLTGVRVIGSWTRPVAAALRSIAGPRVTVRDERGGELDAAIAASPPIAHAAPATLAADLFAVAPSARTLRALSQGEPILLLRAGTKLPATSVSENFASNSFIESFFVASTSGGETTPMLKFDIPRYAERQMTSYLRAVVHCDTPSFMLLEVAYLYPSHRRFAFFDKTLKQEFAVPNHAWGVRVT